MGFFDKRNMAVVNAASGSGQTAEELAELCGFEYARGDLPESPTFARHGLEPQENRIPAFVCAGIAARTNDGTPCSPGRRQAWRRVNARVALAALATP